MSCAKFRLQSNVILMSCFSILAFKRPRRLAAFKRIIGCNRTGERRRRGRVNLACVRTVAANALWASQAGQCSAGSGVDKDEPRGRGVGWGGVEMTWHEKLPASNWPVVSTHFLPPFYPPMTAVVVYPASNAVSRLAIIVHLPSSPLLS